MNIADIVGTGRLYRKGEWNEAHGSCVCVAGP